MRQLFDVARTGLRSRIARNTLALYAVWLANLLVPLATVPYLARVLHPGGWGAVAAAQALALLGALVIEYGFNLSATREVARMPADRPALAELFASVLGARVALAGVVAAGACVARWSVPLFQRQPELVWLGLGWAIAQGFRPYWYFQGLEQLRLVAALDVASKLAAGVGVFVCVRSADDGWRVIALQAAAATLTCLVLFKVAYRDLNWRWPRPRACLGLLRASGALFLFRGAVSLYSAGNVFVLGALAPAATVGYYAGADRIARVALGIFDPLAQTLFPRFSQLVDADRAAAARYARLACLLTGGLGAAGGLLLWLSAPTLIQVALGPEYAPSVSTLRILALLPLEVGLSSALAYYWMLPQKMDRALLTIALLTGLVNIGGACLLAPWYAQNGMALALVCAELLALLAIILTVTYRQSNPLWTSRGRATVAHGAAE